MSSRHLRVDLRKISHLLLAIAIAVFPVSGLYTCCCASAVSTTIDAAPAVCGVEIDDPMPSVGSRCPHCVAQSPDAVEPTPRSSGQNPVAGEQNVPRLPDAGPCECECPRCSGYRERPTLAAGTQDGQAIVGPVAVASCVLVFCDKPRFGDTAPVSPTLLSAQSRCALLCCWRK
ncbi:MAG: hypothetical protein AAFP69_05430 [Planctomycetota bacterium]